MGLSSLRYHKKCHNFIDTPSDICLCGDGIEDIDNFLFLCPLFAAQRATLTSSVIEILQKYNLNHLGNQSNLRCGMVMLSMMIGAMLRGCFVVVVLVFIVGVVFGGGCCCVGVCGGDVCGGGVSVLWLT